MSSQKKYSFSQRLLIYTVFSVSALTLAGAIVNYWTVSQQFEKSLKQYAAYLAKGLAQDSVLALVTHNRQDAVDTTLPLMNLKDIDGVAIYSADSKPIFSQGKLWSHGQLAHPTTLEVTDTPNSWQIVSPVYLEASEQSPFQLEEQSEQYLGFITLNVSKKSLTQLTSELLVKNIIVGLLIAILVGGLMALIVRRLTRPISQLSAIMDHARLAQNFQLAPTGGPVEIATMASSFNQLMLARQQQQQDLKVYSELLESRVAQRTLELTVARDAALSALRIKSEFIANISHELRTPIQSMLGYIELVSEELEYSGLLQQVDDLDKAKQASNRLLHLINSILDLAKTEAGQMKLELGDVSLESVLEESIMTIKPLLQNNNNKLVIERYPDITLVTDREKLLQVILNLLSNACKFTEHGQITISITRDNNNLRLSIQDTGIGLTQSQQQRIFEQFHQVDGSEQRKYGGTGLGLAISRHFAHLLGGDIEVSSQPQQGACFTLVTPITVKQNNHSIQVDKL